MRQASWKSFARKSFSTKSRSEGFNKKLTRGRAGCRRDYICTVSNARGSIASPIYFLGIARNSYSAGSKIPNCGSANPRIRALKAQPPGTEFLDAETGRQKSPPNYANARRDPNPGNQWPKIPAETPYLASHRKRAVCGDCAPGLEPG